MSQWLESATACLVHLLGPIKSYLWNQYGRPGATVFLEQVFLFRINFQAFDDETGRMQTECGWHGIDWTSTSKKTKLVKTRLDPVGFFACQAGDKLITLDGFRHLEIDCAWTHTDMTLEMMVGELEYKLKRCSCAARLRVTMYDWIARVPNDLGPGMTVVDGYATRRRQLVLLLVLESYCTAGTKQG